MRTIQQLMDLEGRVALITGGAGHLGRASAEALLELGARVVLLDLDEHILAGAIEEFVGFGRVSYRVCDLSDERATRDAVSQVIAGAGRLDIVVHSAAFVGTTAADGWAEPFHRQSVHAFEAAMRVNTTSAFVIAQTACEELKRVSGSIILFSSIYGLVGPDLRLYLGTSMQNPLGYGASKAAILQLARSLATSLAPVRVNAISPGGILRGQPGKFIDRYEARTPLKRMGCEQDIKGAVAYLASDLSSYVTGHNLVVDGGWTIW